MENTIKKKKSVTFKSRLSGFMGALTILTFILLFLSLFLFAIVSRNHRDSMNRLLELNKFYDCLESINTKVYEYTLEGEESVYREIDQECSDARGILKEMADMKISTAFYRDIRDIEEMFLSYTNCIRKIYAHSYLCEEMTIGSKQTINKYYTETQDVYTAINSEFQNLYSQLLDAEEEREQMMEIRKRIYLADLICAIVCTIIYEIINMRKITRRVINPVQMLTENATEFEGENLDEIPCVVEEEDMDEEMRHLLQVYNSMIMRIQRQMKEIRENASMREKLKDQELENLRIINMLKSSELKALQMQINPHFLFNTLNMISQTAYLENAEQTAGLINTTARLLRYTLDYTDKSVTLAKEIEILGNYVDLQEQRFGERIWFEFDLDETFHQMQVPSMILQPLVENCISHGVGMKSEGAVIRICTRYDEEAQKGRIIISDNGEGMDEETLLNLQREIKENNKTGNKIGVSNVYHRLMIFFNYKADMKIYSSRETGTTIEIEVPYQNQKAKN